MAPTIHNEPRSPQALSTIPPFTIPSVNLRNKDREPLSILLLFYAKWLNRQGILSSVLAYIFSDYRKFPDGFIFPWN